MAFLGSLVGLVAGKITDLLVEEGKFLYGVKDDVTSLKEELLRITSYLIVMETKGEEGKGNELDETIIKQIRIIAYDVEDVIESYILKAKPPSKNDFLRRCCCFCCHLYRIHQLGSDVLAITGKIDKTLGGWRGEAVVVRPDARGAVRRVGARSRIAYPNVSDKLVVGLKEDIDKLAMVLNPNINTQIRVVSIVGMGGSGKTTLARKLYNHGSITRHFNCMAWVSVSQQWSAQQILSDLLEKVSNGDLKSDGSSTQVLGDKLQRFLSHKKYLIVIDDVWEEDALRMILDRLAPLDGVRRKIIVTTRNQKVVDHPDLKPITHSHVPRRLTESESLELFKAIALPCKENVSELEELGKEMLKKCDGLPLAVVALAGILFKKETPEEWGLVKKVMSSKIMADGEGTELYGRVNDMLELSYIDMPRGLKPCFLYLAHYPEDYEIRAKKLIRMWVAEGFIKSDELDEGETLEDGARRYLDELIHRCLVQIASKNYDGMVKVIQIHDLVRELCIKKAKEEDFLEIFTSESSNLDSMVAKPRRTAIYSKGGTYTALPTNSKQLRSLVYEMVDEIDDNDENLSLKLIHENFRLLRVLVLDRITTFDGKIPSGIGELIHLRYLCLRGTNITQLPPSIGNLRNLQTLDYTEVEDEGQVRIPDVLWKIEGLRHLYLALYKPINGLRLRTMNRLETLSDITGGGWMLEELPLLSESIRKLNITGITNNKQLEAVFQCPSIKSGRLHSLQLRWSGNNVMLKDLEPITSCRHLRKLFLVGRIIEDTLDGIQFPTSVKRLLLTATGFETETTLTTLGKLPNLVVLWLYEYSYIGANWTCHKGEFLKLEELSLCYLENLVEWNIEAGAMPLLQKLSVVNCKKLRRVPEGLKLISSFQKLHSDGMSAQFDESVKEANVEPNFPNRESQLISAPPPFANATTSTPSTSSSFRDAGGHHAINPNQHALHFVEGIENGIVEYNDIDVSEMVDRWKLCLVGASAIGLIGYEDMEEYVHKKWTSIASPKISLTDKGLFVFMFSNEEDLCSILESGPWESLILKRWYEGMTLDFSCFDTVPIWVTLPDLDVRFWSEHMLSRIGSAIGVPLKTDTPIVCQEIQLSQARILVEVSTNTQLRHEIQLRDSHGNVIHQKLQYQLPYRCSLCKGFGHQGKDCHHSKELTNIASLVTSYDSFELLPAPSDPSTSRTLL